MNKENNASIKLKLNKWVTFKSLNIFSLNVMSEVSIWLDLCCAVPTAEEEMPNDQLSGGVSHFTIC